jgi:hypothetical protein
VCEKFSSRRNEIAHGIVRRVAEPIFRVLAYVLLPPVYATNKNKLALDEGLPPGIGIPAYAYTSAEIAYYTEQFYELFGPTTNLAKEIRANRRKRP